MSPIFWQTDISDGSESGYTDPDYAVMFSTTAVATTTPPEEVTTLGYEGSGDPGDDSASAGWFSVRIFWWLIMDNLAFALDPEKMICFERTFCREISGV